MSNSNEKIVRDFQNKKIMIDSQINYQKEIMKYRKQQKKSGIKSYRHYDEKEDRGILIGLILAQKYLNM
jgi:hypothetical protein